MDDGQTGGIRISRRRLLGGAAASAALLTAGGATAAIVLHERGGGTGKPGSAAVTASRTAPAPSRALESADTRLRHLLRRAAFAPTPELLRKYAGMPLDAVVDDLLASPAIDDSATEQAIAALKLDTSKPGDVVATWVARLIRTERPALERQVLFWHGLLTSGLTKTGAKYGRVMLTQNQFFRDHAFDRFDVLLKGVVRDPAMMLWLDVHTSKKGHPNENYARELMELFTLGAGNYTEQDVRESARAHTGYSLEEKTGFVFRPAQHDNGQKTFLGQTGNFDADSIVDIILRQDAAPAHLARKLFEFYAYPDPAEATIAPIAEVARSTGYDTKQVVRAVLTSDAFYSPQAYRAIVKSPTEYAIGALRLLDATPDAHAVVNASRVMGQTLFDPPNVAGWPGGRTWLGTSTWFARVNAAAMLMNGATNAARPRQGTQGFRGGAVAPANLTAIFPSPPASADEAIAMAALATIDGGIADDARATLGAYLDEGGGFAALPEAQRLQRLRGLLTLLVASPEYQLL